MNRDDLLEKRLKEVPQRLIPPEWRREILRESRAAALSTNRPVTAWSVWVGAFNSIASRLLWPHPKAWAGLSAVWLLILGLHLAEREPGQREWARAVARPSPQMLDMLRQQEQLLAELVGTTEPTGHRPPVLPQPRSERHQELLNT